MDRFVKFFSCIMYTGRYFIEVIHLKMVYVLYIIIMTDQYTVIACFMPYKLIHDFFYDTANYIGISNLNKAIGEFNKTYSTPSFNIFKLMP